MKKTLTKATFQKAIRMLNTVKETDIQSAICEYLTMRNVFFWRQNTQPATYFDKQGARQFRKMPKWAKKGIPDIVFFFPLHGRRTSEVGFLEVKSKTGKQSAEQVEFQQQCIAHGIPYFLVRSVEEVQTIL